MGFLGRIPGSLQNPQETWRHGNRKRAGTEDGKAECARPGHHRVAGHASQSLLSLDTGLGPWVLPPLPEGILHGGCVLTSPVPVRNGCTWLADFKSYICNPQQLGPQRTILGPLLLLRQEVGSWHTSKLISQTDEIRTMPTAKSLCSACRLLSWSVLGQQQTARGWHSPPSNLLLPWQKVLPLWPPTCDFPTEIFLIWNEIAFPNFSRAPVVC